MPTDSKSSRNNLTAERFMVIVGIVLLLIGALVVQVAPPDLYIIGLAILGFGVGALVRAAIGFARARMNKN